MVRADAFLDRTTRLLCEMARQETRQVLQSRTLRRALSCRLERPSPRVAVAYLSVPHYWAVYYHDGRGPVRPRRGKFLVYFQNIEDDPRVAPATASPRRYSQTKRLALAPATFRRLVEEGKLIVTTGVRSSVPRPFFRPLDTFQNRARPVVNRRFSAFVRATLRESQQLRIRGTITIPI